MKTFLSFLCCINFIICSISAMEFKNYYKELGVKENATQEEIEEAFQIKKGKLDSTITNLKRQKQTERIKKSLENREKELEDLQKAYHTLSNPASRKEYDTKLIKEEEKKGKQLEKDLTTFIESLGTAKLKEQKKILARLTERLRELEEEENEEIQPTHDLLRALKDIVENTKTYSGDIHTRLNNKITEVLNIPAANDKFEELNYLLFDEGLDDGEKFGGVYWLMYDDDLRNNTIEVYIQIIKQMTTLKSPKTQIQKVIDSAKKLLQLLGNNFPIDSELKNDFKQTVKKSMHPTPPPKKQNPLEALTILFENFTNLLNQLDEELTALSNQS